MMLLSVVGVAIAGRREYSMLARAAELAPPKRLASAPIPSVLCPEAQQKQRGNGRLGYSSWAIGRRLAPVRHLQQRQKRSARSETVIEAVNLGKTFQDKKRGEVKAVDQVSFVCRPGEIYGLLGANGAGKTTTLRMLATILEPTEGTARLCGHDVVEHPERARKHCGFLSTATALYPRLTACEMVEYFGRLNGLDEATLHKRIDQVFDRLDMNGFRDRRCDKLSTGMKQKTSIARTLVHDPPVMIFDEPTLGLDIMTARTIIEFIRECRDRGKTVIFSTHVMSEVEKLCDIVGIIQNGKLLAEGTIEQLRQRHGLISMEEIFVKIVTPHYREAV